MYIRALLVCAGLAVPTLTRADDVPKRDQLSPKALIKGHWVSENGNSHYYFDGDGKLIFVDYGNPLSMTYEISGEKKGEHSLQIKVSTGVGGHDKVIRFTTSGVYAIESITDTFMGKTTNSHTLWKYVDNRTKPEKGK